MNLYDKKKTHSKSCPRSTLPEGEPKVLSTKAPLQEEKGVRMESLQNTQSSLLLCVGFETKIWNEILRPDIRRSLQVNLIESYSCIRHHARRLEIEQMDVITAFLNYEMAHFLLWCRRGSIL